MREDVRRRRAEPPVGGREQVQIAGNDAHEKRIGHILAVQDALVGGEDVVGVEHDAHAGRLQRRLDKHLCAGGDVIILVIDLYVNVMFTASGN